MRREGAPVGKAIEGVYRAFVEKSVPLPSPSRLA